MRTEVNGKTQVYLMLGDPVDQVLAPTALNAMFRRCGLDAVMVPAHVPAEGLAPFLCGAFEAMNVRGAAITIPHKTAALALSTVASPAARQAGAVNAVRRGTGGRLEGDLFDGAGFLGSLRHAGIATGGARVLLLGAGGAASAIAAALAHRADGKPAQVALYDPLPERAAALAQRLTGCGANRVCAVARPDPAGFDVVVNASPLGLAPGDLPPCDPARLAPGAAVVDIVMKNQPTALVRAARARGLRACTGHEMLVQQVPLYLDFFGLPEAASVARSDLGFVRDLLLPPAERAQPSPCLAID